MSVSTYCVVVLVLFVFCGFVEDGCCAKPASKDPKLVEKFKELNKLRTGYEDGGDNTTDCDENNASLSTIAVDERLRKLKNQVRCGFQVIAMSYLRLSRPLLRWYDDDGLIDKAVDTIGSFGENAHKMLVILYNGDIFKTYDMWLFFYYTSEVRSFRRRFENAQIACTDQLLRLYDMHDRVHEELRKNTDVCQGRNRLDVTSSRYGQFRDIKSMEITVDRGAYDTALSLIENYKSAVDEFMQENQRYDLRASRVFTLPELYLNDIGDASKQNDLDVLMTNYDPMIVWGDAKTAVLASFERARSNPISLYDGLKRVLLYHATLKNILKVVMLRIVLTHSVLLADVVAKSAYHNKGWMMYMTGLDLKPHLSAINVAMEQLITKFATVTGMHRDEDLSKTMMFLKNNTSDLVKNKNALTDMIKDDLNKITPPLEGIDLSVDPVVGSALSDMKNDLAAFAGEHSFTVDYDEIQLTDHKEISDNYFRAAVFVENAAKLLDNIDFIALESLFNSAYPIDNTTLTPNEYGGDVEDMHTMRLP